MIVVVTTVAGVPPDRESEWEDVWRQTHPQRDQYPALRTERLLRDTGQPGRYLIFSEWDDREHYDQYIRSSGAVWLVDEMESGGVNSSWAYLEVVEEEPPPA